MNIDIRDCREEDLVAVTKIEDLSFDDPYPYELFLVLLQAFPPGFRVAVLSDGKIVGYCILSLSQQRKDLMISSIAIEPDFRRLGLGSRLMADAIRISTELPALKSADKLVLQVAMDNFAALALYREYGFRTSARIRNYYGRGRDGLQMELALRKCTNRDI